MKVQVGNKEVELKPCPFCGAEAFVWHTNHETLIQCSELNAATVGKEHLVRISRRTDKEAVKAWNERGKKNDRRKQ